MTLATTWAAARPRGRALRALLGRALRAVRWLLVTLAVYAAVRAVFLHVVGSQGLLTPSQSVDPWLVGLALVVLGLRLALIVGVPLVVTYRVVRTLLGPR